MELTLAKMNFFDFTVWDQLETPAGSGSKVVGKKIKLEVF